MHHERQQLAGSVVAQRLHARKVRLAANLELGIRGLSHELDELGAVAPEDRLAAHMCLGVRGAVPVEVVAAGAPPAPVVLGDGRLEPRRPVGHLDATVGAPDRQLPADVRLDGVRFLAGEHGVLVQGAAGAGGEPRSVEEDARPVDHLGLERVVLGLGPGRDPRGARVVLPLVRAELLDGGLDPLDVVLVGEVGAERAAAVVRPVGVDARAPSAEDARPVRRQPREVAPEPLLAVGRVGELHPDAGSVERGLSHGPTLISLCRAVGSRAAGNPCGVRR